MFCGIQQQKGSFQCQLTKVLKSLMLLQEKKTMVSFSGAFFNIYLFMVFFFSLVSCFKTTAPFKDKFSIFLSSCDRKESINLSKSPHHHHKSAFHHLQQIMSMVTKCRAFLGKALDL